MSKPKAYPQEVRVLAYKLHSQGRSRAEIEAELDVYCRKRLKRSGPTKRAIDQWRVDDNWAAQDELAKVDLTEKLKIQVVEEKLGILKRLGHMAETTYHQYLEQIKEGVRITPGQAIYALVELERERLKLMEGQAKGPNIRKIIESVMEPFIEILRLHLGPAFTEKQEEIFDELERKLKLMEKARRA